MSVYSLHHLTFIFSYIHIFVPAESEVQRPQHRQLMWIKFRSASVLQRIICHSALIRRHILKPDISTRFFCARVHSSAIIDIAEGRSVQQYSANVSDVAVQTTDVYQVDAAVLTNISTLLKSACQAGTVNDEEPQLQLYYDEDGIPRNPHLAMSCDASSSEEQCTFCSVIL